MTSLITNHLFNANLCPPPPPFNNISVVHGLIAAIFFFQDHEDPDVWCSKQAGNVPVLLMDKENCYIIVGRCILSKMKVSQLPEAVVAFIATFYLLDFDYPKQYEISMNIIQYFIFEDSNVPEDVAQSFSSNLSQYKKFKSEAV